MMIDFVEGNIIQSLLWRNLGKGLYEEKEYHVGIWFGKYFIKQEEIKTKRD